MEFFVVTIDVEPDCTPSWHYADPLSFEGVTEGITSILHPLFVEHGIVPTYLVNTVVMEDERSVNDLLSLPGEYELGVHLHPEFIEPQRVTHSPAGMKAEMNLCLLSRGLEDAKIGAASELFERSFHRKPRSFRAGRFSAQEHTIRSLCKYGYHVDTSVTPTVVWNDPSRERPIDFSKARSHPYFPSSESIISAGDARQLLEVPVTIRRQGLPFRRRSVWLRPGMSTADEMITLMRTTRRTDSLKSPRVMNMMFHNVEILPRRSPYTQTEEDVLAYMASLRTVFAYVRENHIRCTTLSNLYGLIVNGN